MIDHLDYCDNAIRNGLKIFPVQQNKSPQYGFMWQNDYTEEERRQLIRDAIWGIGLICGGNLLCFDFDADADLIFPRFLQRLWNERKNLAYKFWVEKSPHGYHMIFKVDGEAPGSTKLARRNGDPNRWDEKHQQFECADEPIVQIETKGNGGYFVTFPSPGYVWYSIPVYDGPNMSMKPIWELEPISKADIDWLFEMARSFNTYVPRAKKKATPELSPERKAQRDAQMRDERRKGSFTCNPMKYYGAEFTQEQYEQLLKDYKWQKGTPDDEGRIRYWRPGIACDPTNYSGNLAEVDGCWLLYIFTTNSELPADYGLAAWQFLMYQQGYTAADYPGDITPDEIHEWKEDWFEEQARQCKSQWGPLVENLANKKRIFG